MTKSKTRRGVALGAALLMIILEILAVKGDGFQVAKAGLALLLAILAGGFIAWDFKIPKKLSPIVFLALPAAALCCMEFFTHVPWDLTPLIFFLNYRNSSIRQYEMGSYAYTGFSGSGRDSQLFCGQFSFFSNRALGSVFASHGSKRGR